MTLKELERRIKKLQPDSELTAIVTYTDGHKEIMALPDAAIECLRNPEIIKSCDDEFCDLLLYVGECDPETGEVAIRRSPGPAGLWEDYNDTKRT